MNTINAWPPLLGRLLPVILCAGMLLAVARVAAATSPAEPPADVAVIYVSHSEGDDDHVGDSPEAPLATVEVAIDRLVDGEPAWIVLRRGDVFPGHMQRAFFQGSGASAEEPIVFASYGDAEDPKPVIELRGRPGLMARGEASFIEFHDLHFYSAVHDPDSEHFDPEAVGSDGRALRWLSTGRGLVIDRCRFTYCGITVRGTDEAFDDLVVRNSVFFGSYATDSHAQGIQTQHITGVVIEHNVFDHNGWHPAQDQIDGGRITGPTHHNHNMYLGRSELTGPVVVRHNISARAASCGLQARPGGIVEHNLFIANGNGFYTSGDEPSRVVGNVMMHGGEHVADGFVVGSGPNSLGYSAHDEASYVAYNIFAHDALNRQVKAIRRADDAELVGNIVYAWSHEQTYLPLREDAEYPDPERTIARYDEMMGGEGTIGSFLERARRRVEGYDAPTVIAWIREGFGVENPR